MTTMESPGTSPLRLTGHMVVRNEMDRYLPETLAWLAELTDGRVLVYDDQSTDGTAAYVSGERLPLAVRPDDVPSFADDESACRQAGWQALERAFLFTAEDWILAVDADEFLVTPDARHGLEDVRQSLARAATADSAVIFPVAEVFDETEDGPLVRTDGYWSNITATRLAKWRPDGVFHPRREGGGSIPSNWPRPTAIDPGLTLLHYGYARPEDRNAKAMRYRSSSGHNPVHIDSITRPPRLVKWNGMTPRVPT